jgi:hypothetical protein
MRDKSELTYWVMLLSVLASGILILSLLIQ